MQQASIGLIETTYYYANKQVSETKSTKYAIKHVLRSENVRAYMYMYLKNSKMYDMYWYTTRTQLCGKMHETEHYPM